ncbi:conserved membrane hypothetical protein [Desulfamplus magnetovallimortis]|uniref:Permease n=1 Tax=Desulfamplus magnetovallimortis TaxID=1246637 RepID=A0A1W1HGZ3_9BACT|nr:SO_0444 family Cu/Zn efflux transporter [Desulfamplus magnetovallimortis]SLM31767.1 conserved membrane hypothetical protein [Desulfamplus magnetovallimortis]
MDSLLDMLLKILSASWDVLLDSSIFILFGFFVAGLLKGFIPDDFIYRHLGRESTANVFKASLFGVPLPLCSCGVIPAAAGLRKQGASKGAVTAFMISTPETGVDSMAVSYALLDPLMTIIRPLSAFFTASLTGLMVNILERSSHPAPMEATSFENGLSSSSSLPKSSSEATLSQHASCGCCSNNSVSQKGWGTKFKNGMSFAFGELLNDIGRWLLAGILLAGLITVYISPEFIESYLGNTLFSMLIMIALATPLYVCATASTPIAAALAIKGISPGAALVFLLAGPATNMATITVVSRILGKKIAAIYVANIMVCSLMLGFLVNYIYLALGMNIKEWVHSSGHNEHGLIYAMAALLLLALILKPWFFKLAGSKEGGHQNDCNCGHSHPTDIHMQCNH